VNLPSVTLEQFEKKKTEVIEGRKTEREVPLKCETCNKTFASKATHKQHVESKKHLDTVNNSPKKNGEIVIEKEVEKKPRTRLTTINDQSICLFCNEKSSDVDENLVHMRLQHSFFISDMKYVKNLNGLLKYLGEKIQKGCLCIYCENHHCKDFKSGEAVQNHMMDKGHCFMKTDDFDEYHRYYDFSKSLDDMHNKMYLGDVNEPLKEGEEYLEMESDDEEDNGWEDVDEADEDEEEEEEDEEGKADGEKEEGEGEVKEEKEKKVKRVYRYKVRKVKVLENGEIQLPNGRILGHRKYRHLYRQYYRERLRESHVRNNFLGYSEERSLARLDRENRLIMMKNRIEERLKMKERFENAQNASHHNYSFMKLGIRGNKANMKHYRSSNPL